MIKQRSVPRLVTEVRIDDFESYHNLLIAPHRPAPVIVAQDQNHTLKTMKFSLTPRWSKEAKPKFATHNARIETISEKPTWKEAFQKRHCLVPMTHFIEPIYEGEHAGYMVAFHRSDEGWLMAAGIWEEWVDKKSGEVTESFSIITGEPPRFIAKMGHDRCPIFLEGCAQKDWLRLNDSPKAMIDFLNQKRSEQSFNVENFRPMKPGWEKRK